MKNILFFLLLSLFLFSSKVLIAQPTLFADPSSTYCQGAGGVTLGILNTNTGNSYTLQKQSGTWSNVVTINSPSGGTIYFTGVFSAGNYRLNIPPHTVLTITQTPLPETVYNITLSVASGGVATAAGAGFCSGATSFPTIGLSGSQVASSGVIYKLYKDGSWYNSMQLPATGAALSFGQISDPGVYTIRADRNGCERNMNGSKTITVFPLPNVSFTPNYLSAPANCGSVEFTPVISYTPPGSGAPYTYSWNFGVGSNPMTSTQTTPTSQFPAYGTGTQSFPVFLQVIDKNGCEGTYTNSVSVTQRPDALLEALPFWNNCSNSNTFTLTIINKSTTASTNTAYVIDWDDPNDPVDLNLTPAQFPFDDTRTHTYTSTGSFHLTITATGPGPSNCTDTRIFPVFNGSTPTGGITYDAGILQGCKPHIITFLLSGDAQNNAPTTAYYFDFGDGTPPYTFTQETMPALFPDGKYHIMHTYDTASCAAPGNAFNLTHYIANPCSTVPNNVGGIKISENSDSDFLRDEFPDDPIYVCAGVPKTYTNNTTLGCIIYAGNVYNTTNYYWDFFNDGTIESTDPDPVFTFPTPGLYQVKLTSITGELIPNNCGDSDVVREVCVQGVPVADFAFTNPAPFCANTLYTPENNSTFEPACSVPEYVWTVTPNSGFVFTSGSNSNSFEPTFSFSTPGVYTVQLAVNVYSGATICNTSTFQQVVTIIGPPTVTVNQANIDLCGPGIVNLAAAVTYNANGGTITDYLWTINPVGPVITLPTDPFPTVTISNDITQVYTLTLVADNECGTSTPVTLTITVTQSLDDNDISYAGNTNLCSGMTLTDDIIGTLPSGGNGTYTYTWYIEESSGWTLIPYTTQSLDYNLALTTNPTSFKRVVTSGSCVLESNIIVFSLYPGIQDNSINSPQSVCLGDPVSPLTGSNPTQGTGTYSYVWEQSTNAPLFDVWAAAAAPNDQLGYIPLGISQTTRFRRVVTSGLCSSTSNEVEITVNQIPAINSPATTAICSGDILNYAIGSTVAGTTFQWTVTDLSGGAVTGFSNYPGGSLTTIADVLINTSLLPQTIEYTITPIGPAPTQCAGSDFTLTVTVRPEFHSTYIDKSITVGTSTTLTGVLSGGTPGYTYSWTPAAMLSAPGQASLPNPQTSILFANQTYTLTVTDAAGCPFTQNVVVTTGGVLLQVGITANDADLTICDGNSVTLTATANGGAGNGVPANYSYTWTGLPAGATYIQPWIVQIIPASIGLNTYSVQVGDTYTTANANISVTVNANPTVTSPLSMQICSGDNVNYTPTSNVTGASFTWFRNTNACITALPGANSGNNSISNTLTNNCSTVESISYTITPTGPAPTFCPGTSQTLVVDVMPVASITTTPNSQTVNSGFPTSAVTLTSDVAGAGFHWQFYSVDCPAYFGPYLAGGNTSTMPVQTFNILPGGPNSCEICYEATAYVTRLDGTTCEGPPFYYCYTVNLEPIKYNLECPLPACEGSSTSVTLENSDIGITYQLYQDGTPFGSPQPGCDCPIVWSGITQTGNYMVIATNTSNGVSVPMNNSCNIVFYPNPISNFILASTTNCPGAIITLNWCESDVSYQLWRNGIIPVGSPIIGPTPPTPLNFGPVTDPGVYTIIATATYPGSTCESQINGNVIINANPLEFTFDPSGPQCAGDAFGLIDSETGVSYELWCTPLATGSPIYIATFAGTGSAIPFGVQTVPGTYFIHAINIFTGCDIYFADTKVVWPNPEPYNISPQGPDVCGPTTIGLDDSELGFTYEVHLLDINGIPFPTPSPNFTTQIGTGAALVFGTSNAPGTYVIIAFDQNHICSTQMYGSVTILAEPTQYSIYPTDDIYCVDQNIGTEIFLEDSELGVMYTLSNGGSVLIALPGTGNQINFGFQNQPGTYTITAINTTTSCANDMLGSVTLHLRPLVFTMHPTNEICPGDEEIWLSGSQTDVIYTLFTPGGPIPLPGTGFTLNWGYHHTPGTYHIEATLNAIPTCPTAMDGSVIIHPNPGIFDVMHQGINCISSTIGLSGSELNTTYELIHADGTSLTPPEIFVPVVAGAFWFVNPQPVGNYTVRATNSFGCDTLMNGIVAIENGPTVDAGPADLTICNTPPFSVPLTGNATNYSTVVWTSSSTGVFSAPNSLNTTYILAPEDISSQMVVLTLTAYGSGGCNGVQVTDNITIHIQSPFVDAGADQIICEGQSVTLDGTIYGGTTTGLWSSSGDGTFSPDPATIDATYNPGASDIAAGTVTLTLTTTNATPCPDITDDLIVTINPIPVVADPADQVLCNGSASLPVIFSSSVVGTVFSWTNSLTTIGLAASGTGDIPSFTAVNNGISPVVATITVTPSFTFGGVGCTGSSQTFTITVNPTAQLNDPADQIVCNASSTSAVVFTTNNLVGTTTYNWTNDQTSIGLAASGTGDIAAFTAVNTGTLPVVATITIVPSFTNGGVSCTGPSQSFTITVNPTGQVNDPTDQVVCNGDLTTAVVFTTNNTVGTTTYSWTNDLTSIGLAAGGTGDIASFAGVNTGTAPVVATITVTPTFANGGVNCIGPAQSFTITVNPTGQMNDPADQVVCNGDQTNAVVFSTNNTIGTTTYNWTNDQASIGLAANGTGNIAAFTAVNSGTSPVVATITITPTFTNGGVNCVGPAQSFTITVNPTGQLNDPADQIVCNGDLTNAIAFTTNNTVGTTTYNWTNNLPAIGLAASGTGDIAAFAAVNAGTNPVAATITVIPTFTYLGVNCNGPAQTFTITVNPGGQMNDPDDQFACNGNLTNPVVFTTNNTVGTTTYNWTNDLTSIGLAASGTGDIPAFITSNTGTAPAVATITVTPTFSNGGSDCNGPAQTFTITVNPTGQLNDPADLVACNGDLTNPVVFTTNNTVGTTTYNWTNDLTAIGLAASGTGNIAAFTAVNTGTAPIVANITITPSFTNGGVSCVGPTQTFTISVNPNGQLNDPADQVVCSGDLTTAVLFTTNNTVGTTTYNWTNDLPSIGLAASGTGNISAFTATNAGTAPVLATITVTPTFTNGGVDCIGTPQTFTILVNPAGFITNLVNQVVCNGSLTTAVVFATNNTGGTTTYTWTNNEPGIGLPSSGTGNIPSFTAINNGTSPVVATITVIPTFSAGSFNCPGTPQTFTITVNPLGQVNLPSNYVVCNGSLTNAVVLSTNNTGGTTTFNWTNNQPAIGLPASGTGNLPVFLAVNTGTAPLVAIITLTPVFSNAGIDCQGTPQTFTITVNPTAQVIDPADQIVCNGSSTNAINFGTLNTGGTTTYNWINTDPGIGLAASGTGNIASFTAINTGLQPVVATITVTPTFTNGGVSCVGPSQSFTITVNPAGQLNDPADQVICQGSQSNAVIFTSNNIGGTVSYNWTNDQPGIGLPSSGTGNINPFTGINNGLSPVVATITVTPVFTFGSVSCNGNPQVFTITVNPAGHVNDPVDQVVCNGTLTNAVILSTNNSGGVTTFSWTNDQPSIGLPASGNGDVPVFNAINISTVPIIATITVTPLFSNGGVSCTGNPQSFTITVNPSGQVNDPADQVVCNGDLTTFVQFTTNNSGGNTTYNWTNSLASIGLAASGTGDIPAFVAVNASSSPVMATITVTPVYQNIGVDCQGGSQTFTITVNPTAQVNDPADQNKCHGQLTDPVVFTTVNTGGTTTYSWTNTNPGIGLPASGTGNISSFTPVNPGGSISVAVITVTPHFTNGGITCDGPAQTFSITVYPIFVVGSIQNDQSICYNAIPALLEGTPPTGGNPPYSYQWQYSIDNGLNWYNVTPNGTGLDFQPGALTQTTMYRQIQISGSSCGNLTTNSVIIDVRIPTAYAGPNDTLCGMLPYALSYSTANHAVSYTWTTSGTGSFSGQYNLHATYFPTPADMAAGSVVLTLTIEDICGNVVSDDMTLTLGQLPVSFFSYSTPTCNNYPIQFMDQSSVSSGYIKTWIWDFGDGTSDTIHFPNSPNIQHVFANPGPSFMVTLKVITSQGCSDTFQQVVTTLQAPVANFYFSEISCENEPVQFTNASQLNGSVGMQPFSWNFDDPTTGVSNVSNLEDPTHLFSDTGTYYVRLIVLNYNNCLDTIIKKVHVKPAPPVEYTYDITCMNEPVYFDPDTNIMQVNTIATWAWDFGDGITSQNENAVHVFLSPGIYQVSLLVTDTAGCSNSITHEVIINPLPIAHFEAGTTNCEGMAVHFNELSSTSAGYIVRWEWEFGDGTTATVIHPNDPNVNHTYAQSGSYSVTLRVIESDSCSNEETQTLVIHPKPVSNFDYVDPACENTSVSFLDLSQSNGGGNVVQWAWNFGDPASGVLNVSPLQNPLHQFTTVGQFIVTLVATTSNGCYDSYSDTVTIKAKPAVDFTYDSNCQNEEVQFHPNPLVMNVNAIAFWNWTFGDGGVSTLQSPGHTYLTAAAYTVTLTVQDTSGCSNTIIKTVNIAPQPYADFTSSQPSCNGSAIDFTSLATTPTGYIVRWVWNFDDGNIVTVNNIGNPNVSHTYANYGTFNVSLTIKTNDSCTSTIVKPVVVSPAPLANFSFSAGCVNLPVSFSDLSQSGAGSLSSWSWDFGDPTTGMANYSSQQNPTHTFSTASSSFTVTLVVTNSSGCTDSQTHVVNTTPVPGVDFTYTAGCSNDTTLFVSSTLVNVANTDTWLWDFGDGSTSAEIDPVHVYPATGTYTVTLTITDNNGCQNTKSHTLTVTAPPVAMFQPSSQHCAGTAVLFDDLSNPMGGSITSWYWDFGDGNTQLVNAPASPDVEHVYAAPGSFTVTLRVHSLTGCEDDTQQSLSISPAPLSLFTFTNSCEDTAVHFNGIPGTNGGSAIVGYTWDFGDPASGVSNTSNLQNPYHIYINPGTYQVTLIETNTDGCSDSITQPVIIHVKPNVDYSWSSTCLGTETQFLINTTTTNIPAVASFNWDFGDGAYSNDQDPVHTYTAATTYTVVLTITDTAGCINSKTYPVTITQKPNALFSYNSGCLNTAVEFVDESFTSNGEPITGWHWDFGTTSANDTSNLQNPTWIYTSAGSYNVSLVVSTQGGCKDTIVSIVQVFGIPTAAFLYTAAPCNNGTVYFQDSSYSQQGTIISWYWVFEPGQYSTLQDPIYHFNSPDTCHIVTLVVTDMRGCIDTLVKQVCTPTVLSATFNYTPTCELDTTYFSPVLLSPAGDSLVSFSWNFGEPGSGSNNTSTLGYPKHKYSEAGTYTVILQTRDKFNCEAQKILFVDVKPLPVAAFTHIEGICDSIITFKKPTGNSNINKWHWDFGDGTSRELLGIHPDTIQHKYPDIGAFTVQLTVTNTNGCSGIVENPVFVKPCLQAHLSCDGDTICQNQSNLFYDQSTSGIGISTWRWTFGDGDTLTYSTFQNPITHQYDSSGLFTVRLLVSTQIADVMVQDSVDFTVLVNAVPTAEFTAQSECFGVPIEFLNSSVDNNTQITSYSWLYGDGSPAETSYHSQHLYLEPGTFNVNLIVGNNLGCSDTATYPVSAHQIPEPDFRINNACLNKLAHFENLTPVDYAALDTVRWVFDNGNSLVESLISNPDLVFSEKGTYQVHLYVKDVNGCEATIDSTMEIYPGPRSVFSYTESMKDLEVYLNMVNESRGAQFDTLSYHWDLTNTNYSQYEYQSEAENPVFRLPDYPVDVTDYYDNDEYYSLRLITTNKFGCMDTLTRDYLYKGLFVPTAIAPESFNSDLRVFQPKGKGLKEYHIEVFDRWGNLLWESYDLRNGMGDIGVGEEYSHPGPGWDGKFNGEFVEVGVYIWKVSAVFKDGSIWQGVNAGEDADLSGTVYGTILIIR
ncbi:MAG: PKD domain-containing protein [Bacteroidales bacterium]|nr:PKD domain-containing protein [Bacteroidales bacterium]